jgi:hypothetical protein
MKKKLEGKKVHSQVICPPISLHNYHFHFHISNTISDTHSENTHKSKTIIS